MAAPSKTRVTSDHFHEEYQPDFVERWDTLIDWDRRADGEANFFAGLLRDHGCERVLDAASGTGFHSVALAKAGFEVIAADGHQEMVDKTQRNAREHGLELEVHRADWRQLSEQVPGGYDALVCLGNAFTHLFTEEERVQAMAQFHAVLQPGGLVVIDQRNYDAILDEGFSCKHQYYYCGQNVDAAPEEITDEYVRFRYQFDDGAVHHLTLYPIRQDVLTRHMADAGFHSIRRYGDFKADYKHHEPDFVVQVGEK